MSAPAISFYAGSPSTVCSAQQSCSISSHGSPSDYDPNPRGPPQKPIAGGLSCLFSSPSVLHASSCFSVDDVGALRHDKSAEEIGCSYSSNTKPGEHHSPVSVLQGPARSSPSYGISKEMGESKWGRDRLFRGFVRNALGPSCLEYDAPAIATGAVDGQRDPEEFTFNMEDEFEEEESNCEPYAMEMLSGLQWRHKIFREEFVVRAFHEAERAHRGQVRASGDPYLQHCADTAVLLADIGANAIVVAAGLLHDTMDDSFLNYDSIFKSFGAEVAELVEGVSKLSQLSKLARENNTANKSVEADRLHTMYLAMADARAVLIKLADRLHNMLTLDALPLPKQQRFAKETLEIFVPMANRLGIFNWKEQLENLCFKYLYPEQHKELSTQLAKSFDEAMVANAKCELEEVLKAEGVCYHVLHGRHKSLYSIYSKMLKKNASMREIHDINGLRLIVESEDDCYRALDIVHKLWTKVPGRHKDYIARPKLNGYQSLHTVVQSKDMHPLEVQIRTKEMHMHAEFGFAAHWRYKEGLCRHSSYVLQVVEWARWVLTWQCETMFKDSHVSLRDTVSTRPPCSFPFHSEDCPYNYRPQNDEDPIFVILLENDMMSVQEFPANSTLSDLMERVGRGTAQWMTHGFPLKEELRPRVNSTPAADLDQKLKMGDVIELTPEIPDKALTEYREEIQRMFERGMAVSTADYW